MTNFKKNSHCRLVFMQYLVVFAHRDAEDDRSDVLKTMDPLLSLGSLTADIKQSEDHRYFRLVAHIYGTLLNKTAQEINAFKLSFLEDDQ